MDMIVSIDEAARLLKLGQVVSFPTETAYAFGADATNRNAVEQIYRIKKRLHNKKMPILVESIKQLKTIANVPEVVEYLSGKLHPGPVSLVISTRYPWIGAFRISPNKTAQAILKKVRRPLVATSANLSGKPPSYSHNEVQEHFDIPVVKTPKALPRRAVSTIFDPDGRKFIREGQVPQSEILKHYFAYDALSKIRPRTLTQKLVGKIVNDVLHEARRTIGRNVICGGSVAKGTYLDRIKDIDFFFFFGKKTKLEDKLEDLKKLAGKFGKVETNYAQHPYLKVEDYKGVSLEFIPAYKTRKGEVISAADRSIWHVGWVKALDQKIKDEILIAKQFCMGVGVYGADLRFQGLSGYAIEVLVAKNGGFIPFLEDLAGRKWPIAEKDPVDSKRNVLASVSRATFAKFKRAVKAYLENPYWNFFFPREIPVFDRLGNLSNKVLVEIKKPEDAAIDDAVWGMAKRYAGKIARVAKKEDYRVKRYDVFVGRKIIIMFELESLRKNVKVEVGPPTKSKKHCERFTAKNPQNFIVGDRIWAFTEPRFREFSQLVYATEDKIGVPAVYDGHLISKAYRGYYEKEKQFVCRFLLNKEPWEI